MCDCIEAIQTWCLLKPMEKHLLWHGGGTCLVVKVLDFAGFSPIFHVTLEYLVYSSVSQFLWAFLSFSFVLGRLQSVWKHVCFLYGSEMLTHHEKHSSQTPEQSCCSPCHLSIVNSLTLSLKVINVSGCLYSTVIVFTLQFHYRFHFITSTGD